MTAGTLRLLLLLFLVAMLLLALLFLRRRVLSPLQFTGWGLLALLVPALGPFLVILLRPGGKQPSRMPVHSPRWRRYP